MTFLYDLSVRLKRGEQEIILFDRKPKGNLTSIVDTISVAQFTQQDAHGKWALIATADHAGRSVGRFRLVNLV